MAKKRFIEIYTEGKLSSNRIILDTETGVQYLFHESGYAGGLTPLLGPDGKPIITPQAEK